MLIIIDSSGTSAFDMSVDALIGHTKRIFQQVHFFSILFIYLFFVKFVFLHGFFNRLTNGIKLSELF